MALAKKGYWNYTTMYMLNYYPKLNDHSLTCYVYEKITYYDECMEKGISYMTLFSEPFDLNIWFYLRGIGLKTEFQIR
jgi:hypothetical protein